MRIITHIRIQIKIFGRYTDLLFGGLMIYFSYLMIMIAFYEYKTILNMPLLIIIICTLCTGPFMGDIFCGGQSEKRIYCITTGSVRSIFICKNIALILIILVFPIPLLFSSSFYFHSSLQNYMVGGLYFITSIPVFMIVGNLVSVWINGKEELENTSRRIIFQFLMFIAAFIPYLIFQVWLQSVILCILFSMFSILGWYYYVLPIVENRFRKQNFNLDRV